jgi:recombination protein RecA
MLVMSTTEEARAVAARDAALQGAMTYIDRKLGNGLVMRMSDESARVRCDAIPTGALSLDLALGIGGVRRGRIVEVFGPESSGKTTLIYHVLAEAQKLGGVCAFIDAEHAMDRRYARETGVDVDGLLVSRPDNGERGVLCSSTSLISKNCTKTERRQVRSITSRLARAVGIGDEGPSRERS